MGQSVQGAVAQYGVIKESQRLLLTCPPKTSQGEILDSGLRERGATAESITRYAPIAPSVPASNFRGHPASPNASTSNSESGIMAGGRSIAVAANVNLVLKLRQN